MNRPDRKLSDYIDTTGFTHVIGIDEVGLGALAGPVVLGGAVLEVGLDGIPGIKDSKRYTKESSREKALGILIEKEVRFECFAVSKENIENSFSESFNAGCVLLVDSLVTKLPKGAVPLVVMDGKHGIKGLFHPQIALVKADDFVPAVSAASIAAKVSRDQHMTGMGMLWPEFSFDRHKGYGTQAHLRELRDFGYTDIHRQTYRPVTEQVLKGNIYGRQEDSSLRLAKVSA